MKKKSILAIFYGIPKGISKRTLQENNAESFVKPPTKERVQYKASNDSFQIKNETKVLNPNSTIFEKTTTERNNLNIS